MFKIKTGISFVLSIVSFVLQTTSAHSAPTEYIIKGQISDAPENVKEIKFLYYRQYFSKDMPADAIELSTQLVNGRFVLRSSIIDKLGYLQIVLIDGIKGSADSNPYYDKVIGPQFLVEPGDDINLDIKGNDLTFSGKGAEKYNIAVALNNVNYAPSSMPRTKGLVVFFSYERQIVDSIYRTQMDYLRSKRGSVSKKIYTILKINAECANRNRILSDVIRGAQLGFVSLNDQTISGFNLGNQPINSITKGDSLNMLTSNTYTDYLFYKRYYNATFGLMTRTSRDKQKFYSYMFNSFFKSYSGLLRQKLLITLFKNRLPSNDSLNVYFSKAANLAKPGTRYYQILNDFTKYTKGVKAYNFILQDTSGHVFKLSDFRNKIVVIDLYYEGCYPCSELNKAMKPIVEKYKSNPNVVFVTINQDSKERFVEAVRSGLYTHENSINLYTNGLLSKHPFIQYYEWNSAPQQMIVDKFGKILAMNPLRPALIMSSENMNGTRLNPNDPGTLKMIEIIEEGLSAI